MEPGCSTLWCSYLSVQFSEAHLLSELGFTIVFELLQLVFVLTIWKRIVAPRIHQKYDTDHHIQHNQEDTEHDDHNRDEAEEFDQAHTATRS